MSADCAPGWVTLELLEPESEHELSVATVSVARAASPQERRTRLPGKWTRMGASLPPYPVSVMRTRTLLLLAVSCGLVILIAGAVLLLQFAGQADAPKTLAVGQAGRAGDASVVVQSVTEADDTVTVVVRLSGVDDVEGLSGFSLAAPNVVVPFTSSSGSTCNGFTVEPRECTLVFELPSLSGGGRILLFSRAGTVARWTLAGE